MIGKLHSNPKGRPCSIITRLKISQNHADFTAEKNPTYGRKWCTNGVISRTIHPGKEELPDGFWFGRFILRT